MVVFAVYCEPVSGAVFPDIRENTGKIAKMSGISIFAAKFATQLQQLANLFPDEFEQGNFAAEQGKNSKYQGMDG